MKTGNKKQAILLSVVAVGAIFFLGHQLMPSKLAAIGLASSAPAPATIKIDSGSDLPFALVGNPFSHPKLAVKPVAASQAQLPFSDIDKSGVFHPLASDLPATGSYTRDSGSTPEGNAGEDRQKDQASPEIRLAAVMAVGQPIALLEVNGTEAKEFSVGDQVAEGTKLIKIEDRGVTIKVNGVLHFIAAGGTFGSKETDK